MTTKELRDLYTEKKTLHRSAIVRANEAKESILNTLKQIDMDFVSKLPESHGIDLSVLQTMDLERLQTDQEYLNEVQAALTEGAAKLKAYVERNLNV